jgi:hypothetical protein
MASNLPIAPDYKLAQPDIRCMELLLSDFIKGDKAKRLEIRDEAAKQIINQGLISPDMIKGLKQVRK